MIEQLSHKIERVIYKAIPRVEVVGVEYLRIVIIKVCECRFNLVKGDVIDIVETWKHKSYTIIELQGFILVGSTWNQRRQHARRYHVDIDTLIKSKFQFVIHLKAQDTRGQYNWLCLVLRGSHCYLTMCYLAPLSMPIYFTRFCKQSQSFHRLIKDVLKYKSKWDVFLAELLQCSHMLYPLHSIL